MRRRAVILAALLAGFGRLALGCSCVSLGVKSEASAAGMVFRGVAKEVVQLPARKENGRPRYRVTFEATEYWKGAPSRTVVMHVLKEGTDCLGFGFRQGREYVVFAAEELADDHRLDQYFWYGWLDLLVKGTKIWTVHGGCNPTGEVGLAEATVQELGRGRPVEK